MIEIKLLDHRAKVPKYATDGSAAVDLIACMDSFIDIPPMRTTMIHTGIALNMSQVSEHFMAEIVPRSGKGAKEGKVLGNLTGIIDKDYQGELLISLWNRNPDSYVTINPGEAIAQMIFIPIIKPTFKVVEEFSSITERGEGGFGSTDLVK